MLDSSYQHNDEKGTKNNKSIDWIWIVTICILIVLCGFIIYLVNKPNNETKKIVIQEKEETVQKPSNPLDIKEKTVFAIKSSHIISQPLYYDLKTGKRTYHNQYPGLGDLRKMIFYPDSTVTLLQSNGEKRETKCRYIEDEFHGSTHKAIVFTNPNNIRGIVIISENYKVIEHRYDLIDPIGMNSDAKTILARAEENKGKRPDYILEKEVSRGINVSETALQLNIKQLIQSINDLDNFVGFIKSEGFEQLEATASNYWVKNCDVKKVNMYLDEKNPSKDDIIGFLYEPDNPDGLSVFIDHMHNGPLSLNVWNQSFVDDFKVELKEQGYQEGKGSKEGVYQIRGKESPTIRIMEPGRNDEKNCYTIYVYTKE